MSDITTQKPDRDMIWVGVEKALWEKTIRDNDALTAHVAALRGCVSDAQKWAARWAPQTEHRNPNANASGPYTQHPHGYAICPIPDWEVKQKRDDYAAALAATPEQSLERVRAESIRVSEADLKRAREQREDLWRLLMAERSGLSAEKGNLPLEPAHWPDLKRHADEGIARIRNEAAAEALRAQGEAFDARAFHVGGPAEKAFMECRDACNNRAAELDSEASCAK